MQLALFHYGDALLGRRRIQITDDGGARLHGTELFGRACDGQHGELAIRAMAKCVNGAVELKCPGDIAAVSVDLVNRARVTPRGAQGKAHLAGISSPCR